MAASRGTSVDENSSLHKSVGRLLNRHLIDKIRGMNTQAQSLIQMAVPFTQTTSQ